MKKFIAVFIVLTMLACVLGGCDLQEAVSKVYVNDAVMDTVQTHDVSPDIRSMNIKINAAELTIRQADRFFVQTNLRYVKVTENAGVLHIREEMDHASGYNNAMLTIYLPQGMEFENLTVETAAAKLTADRLCAGKLKLALGAGDTKIGYLSASAVADIDGGAGKLTISDGSLRNLELEMDVGKLELRSALQGNCELTLNVSGSDITLLGSREDYTLELEKGLGKITVDGKEVTDFGISGSGQNHVEIEGGVGIVKLKFES